MSSYVRINSARGKEAFEDLVFEYFTKENLIKQLEAVGFVSGVDTTYSKAIQMVNDGFFDVYYDDIAYFFERNLFSPSVSKSDLWGRYANGIAQAIIRILSKK